MGSAGVAAKARPWSRAQRPSRASADAAKRCQSTKIFIPGPGGYEVLSRMYFGWEVVGPWVPMGGGPAVAHAGPPLEQGTRGRQKRRATAHPGTRGRKRFPKGDE